MTAANNDASPMDGAPVIDFDKFKPTRSFTSARKRKDFAMKALISCAFIVALIPLFSVLLTTIINGVKRLNLNFLSYNMTGVVGGNPTPSGGYGGILHAIIGTLEITFGAMLISIPIGLLGRSASAGEVAGNGFGLGIGLGRRIGGSGGVVTASRDGSQHHNAGHNGDGAYENGVTHYSFPSVNVQMAYASDFSIFCCRHRSS